MLVSLLHIMAPGLRLIHLLVVLQSVRHGQPLCNNQRKVSASVRTIEYDNKCYELNDLLVTWYEAKRRCGNRGGQLAMIDDNLIRKDPDFRQLLEKVSFTACLWLGLTDQRIEGHWEWIDGSPARTVTFSKHNLFLGAMEYGDRDCGLVCRFQHLPDQYMWTQRKCNGMDNFVCQYDAVTPDPDPTSSTGFKNHQQSRERKTEKRTVCRPFARGFLMTEQKLFEMRTPSMTICARLCIETCEVFSYNLRTRQCYGFVGTAFKLEGEKNSEWDTWEIVNI